MLERFTGGARAAVVQAQEQARRLGHRYIGCEHLLLAAASAAAPAASALREHGVTPNAVEAAIVRLIGRGETDDLFSALDREALATIGIDLMAVRDRIEATFGPGALTRVAPAACLGNRPAWLRSPIPRLLRRRRRCRAGSHQRSTPGQRPADQAGHLPFTPRAKKSLENARREAAARHDSYVGIEHLTLALVAMETGSVPPILSALGTSPATLRTAILSRYRQAS